MYTYFRWFEVYCATLRLLLDQRTRSPTEGTEVSGNFGKNVSVAGNKITIAFDTSLPDSNDVGGQSLTTEDLGKKFRRKSAESTIDFDKLKR